MMISNQEDKVSSLNAYIINFIKNLSLKFQ